MKDARRSLRLQAAAASVATASLFVCAQGVRAEAVPMHGATAQATCAKLAEETIGGAKLTTAVVAASGDVPAYCKVSGTIAPDLSFEIRLPDRWNGRLYYFGGGGYDGSIPPLATSVLAQGYAEVASNGGHHDEDGMSAAFMTRGDQAAKLFGSLSVPTVIATARKIVTTAYDAPPAHAYFEGCSNGGREALMAVQRNPELFDGVIARAPGYNWVGFMGEFNRTAKAIAAPGGEFSTAKLALLARHVRKACDALDGVVDGVVSNPSACTAKVQDIEALRCLDGRDTGDTCLSDAQLAVLKSWTTDVQYRGSSTYRSRGYNLTGNEDDPMSLSIWLMGNGNLSKAAQFEIQDTTVKYYLAHDPKADSLKYTPWDQNTKALADMAALNDATDTDISAFIRKGGKLIVWHGGSDAGLSVNSTIDYMDGVRKSVGAAKADMATRFYIAPGVNHCEGGAGADKSDLLTALDQWVSKGVAPATLTAQKLDAHGAVAFTRPLCQYPKYPRYIGPADNAAAARLAASYTCTAP